MTKLTKDIAPLPQSISTWPSTSYKSTRSTPQVVSSFCKAVRRKDLLTFFASLPSCLIGLEAT